MYYFEVMINSFNLNRPGIAIGLTDETFVLNKIPGSSRRSYGLRSDGKLLHAISQGLDFSPKFEQNDVIGCGITYISRKIFFTRNGELLGKPFDMLESYPIFASASISCPQDSVTFTFTGPFQFDLSGLISDEKTQFSTEIAQEPVHCGDIYRLVHEYLEFQGYSSTLKSFEDHIDLRKPSKSLSKLRSFSGRFSERYDSIDIDPECQACQTNGRVCKVCLKKVIENVEPSSNIRLPESRYRCDSVDLSSLYMRSCEVVAEESESPLQIRDAQIRGALRQVILTGNMRKTSEFIVENFPDLLSDEVCMLYLHVQEFIEMIKLGEVIPALEFAREKMARFRNYTVFYRDRVDIEIFVWEVVGLLAYDKPMESPLASLLDQSQLELTADLINKKIMQKCGSEKCKLESILKQAICTQYIYQENVLMAKPSYISFNY